MDIAFWHDLLTAIEPLLPLLGGGGAGAAILVAAKRFLELQARRHPSPTPLDLLWKRLELERLERQDAFERLHEQLQNDRFRVIDLELQIGKAERRLTDCFNLYHQYKARWGSQRALLDEIAEDLESKTARTRTSLLNAKLQLRYMRRELRELRERMSA